MSPVEHRRNAEQARPARHFRYLHPLHRLRRVGAVEKPGPDLGPVVLQVIAQVIDGHAVDAWRPFVAPDTCQRPSSDCRAPPPPPLTVPAQPPGVRVRRAHAGFGPLVSGAPGFTLRLRLQGQFQLDFLPLGPHERSVLLTLSVVRAFAGKPATMPSADFWPRSRSLRTAQSGISGHGQISRGKTDRLRRTPAGSTIPALDGYGLRGPLPARPAG